MKITVKNISKKKIRKAGNTYNALFMIDGLDKRLVRSMVEINNNQYIRMWRDCFDTDGRFSRSRFNQYRHEFENWDEAFSLIWLDLKSINRQDDRTAIINCLMRLITDDTRINQYVDFILKDFFFYPLHLHYSDINALIFVNMLLFEHFAMRNHDFEFTPEDVLLSRDGKNKLLIDRLSALIESQWGDRFIEKIKTIKTNLYLSLDPQKEKSAQLLTESLIRLLREVFVFLTLVGGKTIYKVVRDTVEEFSHSDSALYSSQKSHGHLKSLLRFFQLSIRCLIILGDDDDIEVLKCISMREKDFMSLKGLMNKNLAFHQKSVRNIVALAQDGMATLKRKGKNFNSAELEDDVISNALDKTFVLED